MPIYYESRVAKLGLNQSELPKIDEEFEAINEGEELTRCRNIDGQQHLPLRFAMADEPVWAARHLLDKLEDPFTMFPMEGAADALYAAVNDAETGKIECTSPFDPAARKFWSVEKEYYHEKIGLLMGALFVLGQAAITQSESVLNELRRLPSGQSAIPDTKGGKLRQYAPLESHTDLSEMVIINATSNYFKHGYAWPDDWNVVARNGSKREVDTIEIVRKLGMDPKSEMTDNLLRVAERLRLGPDNPRALTSSIQEWRENWARTLYAHFGVPDPAKS